MIATAVPCPGEETERRARRGTESKLARGLHVLRAFRGAETELMLKQLTARAGLAAGTAHRLARELADLGMLDRMPGGYRPGAALANLALRATTWPALTAAAGPTAEFLHGLSGCPVTLYVPSGGGLLPVWRMTSQRSVVEYRAVPCAELDLSPLLPLLRRRDGPQRHGSAVLAPIQGEHGRMVAALGITGEDGPLHRFWPAVLAAAREIGGEPRWTAPLGAPPPAGPAAVPAQAKSSVLARGLGLLDCLRPGEHAIRPHEVAERVGMPRSTVDRCLDELIRGGLLERDDERLGFGALVRRIGPLAVAPRLRLDDRLHQLAAVAGTSCWLTPVDPDSGVPLNGLVLRHRTGAGDTVRYRRQEWALVVASVATTVSGTPGLATGRRAGPRPAVSVPVRYGDVPGCLTVVTKRARLPFVERALAELEDRPVLSA